MEDGACFTCIPFDEEETPRDDEPVWEHISIPEVNEAGISPERMEVLSEQTGSKSVEIDKQNKGSGEVGKNDEEKAPDAQAIS